jgi:hypothetical protein
LSSPHGPYQLWGSVTLLPNKYEGLFHTRYTGHKTARFLTICVLQKLHIAEVLLPLSVDIQSQNFLFPCHNKYTVPHYTYPPTSYSHSSPKRPISTLPSIVSNSYCVVHIKTEKMYCLEQCCKQQLSSCHSKHFVSYYRIHNTSVQSELADTTSMGHQYMKLG